jgi:hypothetical protein
VWARWDGRFPHTGGNQFAISPMYGSFDSLVENVLATSGGVDKTGYTPPSYQAEIFLIGTDPTPLPEDVDRWEPGRDAHDVQLRVLASIAYSSPGQRFRSNGVMMTRAGIKGSVLQDIVVSIPESSDRVIFTHGCVDNEFGCVWKPNDVHNKATRLTLIGGRKKLATKSKFFDWQQSDLLHVDDQVRVDVFTPGNGGASVCYRTVDGFLTQQPLWPWPMNARILAATRASGWGEADVTADIETIFGKIPAQCRDDASS